ncbi:ATP-dependent_DNA helicase RecQ [Hexamita inflata]|uniref:DNA 3'-5' helicase n=1 Tax=Hexamita inflata TaxID=28002 RepID=A0AA86RCZ2_9EUKA|nr:ATP-dependent DNA helicase RecQ [Hexamita inflata]
MSSKQTKSNIDQYFILHNNQINRNYIPSKIFLHNNNDQFQVQVNLSSQNNTKNTAMFDSDSDVDSDQTLCENNKKVETVYCSSLTNKYSQDLELNGSQKPINTYINIKLNDDNSEMTLKQSEIIVNQHNISNILLEEISNGSQVNKKDKSQIQIQKCQFNANFLSSTILQEKYIKIQTQRKAITKYNINQNHDYVDDVTEEQLIQLQYYIYLQDRISQQQLQSSFKYFDQMENARKILNIPELRRHQQIAVDNILQNKNQLISIATSGGKSLIYTLPTIILNKITIVISPTIALRNDQVNQLIKLNVKSYQLSSEGNNSIQPHEMLTIDTRSVVFITPERLNTENTIEVLKYLVYQNKIALFAIDECHLMVDWQDFRKDFLSIPSIFSECRNQATVKQPTVIALTASISPDDTEVIQQQFAQNGIIMESLIFDVYRPNLGINIITVVGPRNAFLNQEEE